MSSNKLTLDLSKFNQLVQTARFRQTAVPVVGDDGVECTINIYHIRGLSRKTRMYQFTMEWDDSIIEGTPEAELILAMDEFLHITRDYLEVIDREAERLNNLSDNKNWASSGFGDKEISNVYVKREKVSRH